MKPIAVTAALVVPLAACGDSGEPIGPPAADPPQHEKTRAEYDAAGAGLVVADLLVRVLPTLTPGPALATLETELDALATALLEPDAATLRDYVDGAKEALKAYGTGAPDEEEPELDGVDFALDHVSEGLPPPSGRGKGRARGA